MSDVILERTFSPVVTVDDVREMSAKSFPCFSIYQVKWRQSMLALDGSRMFCHFECPDAESIRNAMRYNNSPFEAAYPIDLHDTGKEDSVNVLVEREWQEPVELKDIAALEEVGAWCLEAHNVSFVRTFFSTDQKRMVCLYRAPDAESVRMAQSKADMPFDKVWAFKHLTPEVFAA